MPFVSSSGLVSEVVSADETIEGNALRVYTPEEILSFDGSDHKWCYGLVKKDDKLYFATIFAGLGWTPLKKGDLSQTGCEMLVEDAYA
jgi:hypothetical protein